MFGFHLSCTFRFPADDIRLNLSEDKSKQPKERRNADYAGGQIRQRAYASAFAAASRRCVFGDRLDSAVPVGSFEDNSSMAA